MVGGCLAQKDRELVRERAPHVDVVFGTHNVAPRRRAARTRPAATGPIIEILEEAVARRPRRVPLGAAGPPRESTTPPGSRSRSAATTLRLLHRARGAGPRDQPAVRRHRRRGRGARRRRRHRGHAARPERQLLRPRPHARRAPGGRRDRVRPLFADLLRAVDAVDGIQRVRFTSPAPEGPAPETIAAMAETPAVCEHLHLPLQSGSDRVLAACTAATPPSATSSGWPRPAPPSPTSPSPPTSSSASPARPTTTSRARSRWSPRPRYDSAYTFVFSPRPGTEAAEHGRRLRRPDGRAPSASSGCGSWSSASALATPPRPGSAGSRRCSSRARPRRTRRCSTGRTRQNKLVHFRPRRPLRPGSYAAVEVTGAAPHHLSGELRRGHRRAAHRTRIPVAAG